jgi:glycosyltransferase involved in cell wall biosynthesis
MNDPEALAAGILRLLREPQTAERLGAQARQRYQERYRPDVMSRALENLFVELIDSRTPARSRSSSRLPPVEARP